jgi:biofilm PGA synthesis N-glycosyltransferase PgaC
MNLVLIFFILLLLVTFFLSVYYVSLLLPWINQNSSVVNHYSPFVSVIICSRNGLINLQENLPLFLAQNYPSFEVVVVDDASTDSTYNWLLQLNHPLVKIVQIENKIYSGKRNALLQGLTKASGEWMMLTDVDCKPADANWLLSLVQSIPPKSNAYIGISPYNREDSLLNRLIRWDALSIALQYTGFAYAGFPYMGVGRNMGWHISKKNELISVLKNSISDSALPISGDDDITLQQMLPHIELAVIKNPSTFLYSTSQQSLNDWLKQKSRHHTTGWKYPWRIQLMIGTIYLSKLLFFPLVLLCILHSAHIFESGIILLVLYMLKRMAYTYLFKKLLQKDLIAYIFLLDIIHIFVIPIISIQSLGRSNKAWK